MSDSGSTQGDRAVPLLLPLYVGVPAGIIVLFLVFLWGWSLVKRARLARNAANDIELGNTSSRQPQIPRGAETNRFDGSQLDATLPAYKRRQTDEGLPSLFQLSSSIASLKATEDDPVTSPYHLILYERISKLQVLIKKVQRIFGNSPPDGYTPDAEERKEVEALKKEMLELIGTPEPLAEREASSRRESNRTSMLTVVGTPEPGSSAREEALRREQLVQIHSLITLLAPPASGSTEQDASTFESLEECIDALLRSLESVPIPTPTPSISGEHESMINDGDRNTGVDPNASHGGQLPPSYHV